VAVRALVLSAAFAVLLAHTAGGTDVPSEPGVRVAQIRLEGYVGAPARGRSSAADLAFEHGEKRIRFQVESARVIQGNRSGPDFLDEVSAAPAKLTVEGPDELLDELERAQPGNRVVLTGYHRTGSRNFAVSAVEVETAPQ
jgi:hypothetical protein